jgi:hypothetical protein
MRWNGQEGRYLKHGSDLEFNDECFVLNSAGAVAGYLKFKGKGEPPERPIYPRDEAPERASLGDTDQSEWPIGRFSNEPEDPWTPVIELPLKHKETGEEYILTCQSKTAIGAAKDLFSQLRRVPPGHDPVIKLAIGSMQTRYGKRKSRSFPSWVRCRTRMARQRRRRRRQRTTCSVMTSSFRWRCRPTAVSTSG